MNQPQQKNSRPDLPVLLCTICGCPVERKCPACQQANYRGLCFVVLRAGAAASHTHCLNAPPRKLRKVRRTKVLFSDACKGVPLWTWE